MENIYWVLVAFVLLALTAAVAISRIMRNRRLRREQEATEQEEQERIHRHLEQIRTWDTTRSLPLVGGYMETGELRRFLLLPTMPGAIARYAHVVKNGSFVPCNVGLFNNKDSKHTEDVRLQIQEIQDSKCLVVPPGTTWHLYEVALRGSTLGTQADDEMPKDTVCDPSGPAEEVPHAIHGRSGFTHQLKPIPSGGGESVSAEPQASLVAEPTPAMLKGTMSEFDQALIPPQDTKRDTPSPNPTTQWSEGGVLTPQDPYARQRRR